MPKVVHVITGLHIGGAEMMLFKLLSHQSRSAYESEVISLLSGGDLVEKIESLGIAVHCLNMKEGKIPAFSGMIKLVKLVRKFDPDVIQGWMYHGNIAALYVRFFSSGNTKLLWNVRHALHDIRKEKRLTRYLIKIGALLSGFPRSVIYNSRTSARHHEGLGYKKDRTEVISNGFDLSLFYPDMDAFIQVRSELGISPEAKVIGHVARFHEVKDHATFLEAAAMVLSRNPHSVFVCVGRDVAENNSKLKSLIDVGLIGQNYILLGERDDIPRLMRAFDLLVLSSSYSESFPNVIGEAMASGVCCVATNIGDIAEIIGTCGAVVEPKDAQAMANAIEHYLGMEQDKIHELGKFARESIASRYSIENIVGLYSGLYSRI